MNNYILLLIYLIVLIFISAFFSASETALIGINRYKIRHQAKQGNHTAKLIQNLLRRPDIILSVILLFNTLSNILASAIATSLALHIFHNFGIAIVTIGLTLIVLIFAETLPKTIATNYATNITKIVIWPLAIILYISYPVIWFLNQFIILLMKILKLQVSEQRLDNLTQDELRTILGESFHPKHISYRDMLLHLLDLERLQVIDIMTPFYKCNKIDITYDWLEIIDQLKNSPQTDFIIYRNNLKNILGYLSSNTIFNLAINGKLNKITILKNLQEIYFIPQQVNLLKQLTSFQQYKKHFALIVDEYGNIDGSIHLNDILELIIGDLSSLQLTQTKKSYYIFSGSKKLREINKTLPVAICHKNINTLSGYIIDILANIPNSGTCLKTENYYIEILQVKSNKIKTVKLIKR